MPHKQSLYGSFIELRGLGEGRQKSRERGREVQAEPAC